MKINAESRNRKNFGCWRGLKIVANRVIEPEGESSSIQQTFSVRYRTYFSVGIL
jgi:hypothetical protein